MRPDEEPRLDSCMAIGSFLDSGGHEPAVVELLLRDLMWKSREMSATRRSMLLGSGLFWALPSDIQALHRQNHVGFKELQEPIARVPERVDVGIVTLIAPEKRAVLQMLGLDPDERAHVVRDQCQYWRTQLRMSNGTVLDVVVTMVGVERNVPCAIAVTQMAFQFDMELLVLCGIAAGPRGSVKLGDVVLADRVYDYEHVRLEVMKLWSWGPLLRVSRPRPEYYTVPQSLRGDLDAQCARVQFRQKLEHAARLRGIGGPFQDGGKWPEIHDGTIAAGEKLIADGSLLTQRRRVDQRIRAGAQEDVGFARAAHANGINWCVFRGICDYGDYLKNSGWHDRAAMAAASVAIDFLEAAWRGPSRSLPSR